MPTVTWELLKQTLSAHMLSLSMAQSVGDHSSPHDPAGLRLKDTM